MGLLPYVKPDPPQFEFKDQYPGSKERESENEPYRIRTIGIRIEGRDLCNGYGICHSRDIKLDLVQASVGRTDSWTSRYPEAGSISAMPKTAPVLSSFMAT